MREISGMFISNAWAQDAAASGGSGGLIWLGLQMVAILAVFYFLFIRPQGQQAKARAEMLGALKTGDTVLLLAGFVGVIRRVFEKEKLLEVELLPSGERMWVERGAIERTWDSKNLPKVASEPAVKKR